MNQRNSPRCHPLDAISFERLTLVLVNMDRGLEGKDQVKSGLGDSTPNCVLPIGRLKLESGLSLPLGTT